LIYLLFKKQEGLDAFYIADSLGMNLKASDEFFDKSADLDEPLKSWIRLGGNVNFAWLENHGYLDYLIMGQHPFEQLRKGDPIFYAEMKEIREKANKRWSNDWKPIKRKILTARTLMNIKPNQDSLDLTWQSMLSSCARKLQQINMQAEAKKIQELSFKNSVFMLKNITHK